MSKLAHKYTEKGNHTKRAQAKITEYRHKREKKEEDMISILNWGEKMRQRAQQYKKLKK